MKFRQDPAPKDATPGRHPKRRLIVPNRPTQAFGDRTDAMLALCWSLSRVRDIGRAPRLPGQAGLHGPLGRAYGWFFAGAARNHANTRRARQGERQDESQPGHRRWPSRQSGHASVTGLVRRSCGMCGRIETDLVERFLLLVDGHNLSLIHI